MKRNNQNVTFIEDLPELKDIEDNIQGNNIQGNIYKEGIVPSKYNKFIRESSNISNIPYESGMILTQKQYQPHQIKIQEMIEQEKLEQEKLEQEKLEHRSRKSNSYYNNGPSCLVVAEHISTCPLCSKFYKNDNTLYIIIIIMLLIVILLLLKKILDV